MRYFEKKLAEEKAKRIKVILGLFEISQNPNLISIAGAGLEKLSLDEVNAIGAILLGIMEPIMQLVDQEIKKIESSN